MATRVEEKAIELVIERSTESRKILDRMQTEIKQRMKQHSGNPDLADLFKCMDMDVQIALDTLNHGEEWLYAIIEG